MKQYKLKKWYPSLPKDWKGREIIFEWLNNIGNYVPINNIYPRLLLKKDTIENNPEFWEEIKQFEVGKWYKHNHNNNNVLAMFTGNKYENYGFIDKVWSNNILMQEANKWQEAADEEVKERLLQYAKINYIEGTIIRPLVKYGISDRVAIIYKKINVTTYTIEFIDKEDEQEIIYTIYRNGKWSKIIEKPLFKDKNDKYWYKSDFKENDVWYIETNDFRILCKITDIINNYFTVDYILDIDDHTYYDHNEDNVYFYEIENIRKATKDEINWFEKCEKAGKYVEKEEKLPKSWKEYIKNTDIELLVDYQDFKENTCKTLFKLLTLRDIYRGNWKPDWNNNLQIKYSILLDNNNWIKSLYSVTFNEIFSFRSEKIRDEFYNNFKEMLEKIKPLFN